MCQIFGRKPWEKGLALFYKTAYLLWVGKNINFQLNDKFCPLAEKKCMYNYSCFHTEGHTSSLGSQDSCLPVMSIFCVHMTALELGVERPDSSVFWVEWWLEPKQWGEFGLYFKCVENTSRRPWLHTNKKSSECP